MTAIYRSIDLIDNMIATVRQVPARQVTGGPVAQADRFEVTLRDLDSGHAVITVSFLDRHDAIAKAQFWTTPAATRAYA